MRSSAGRIDWILSARSTISITIGRSSERRRIFVVWMRLFAPNPDIPRRTVAPARPASRAASTIASWSGRPSQWSLSPTKMRSSCPSPSNFIAISSHAGGAQRGAPQPHRGEPGRHAACRVDQREPGLVRAQQLERLPAEGREGGEAAEDADHEEDARVGPEHGAVLDEVQHGADREAPGDVDRQRAPREAGAGPALHEPGERVARDPAEEAPGADAEAPEHAGRMESTSAGRR